MDGMTPIGLRDTLIAGARVIDPASGFDGVADVFIQGGMVADIAQGLAAPEGTEVVQASSTCGPNWASPAGNIERRSNPRRALPPPAASRRSWRSPIRCRRSTTRRWCGCCGRAVRKPAASPSSPMAP
jgi:hypothetical protein